MYSIYYDGREQKYINQDGGKRLWGRNRKYEIDLYPSQKELCTDKNWVDALRMLQKTTSEEFRKENFRIIRSIVRVDWDVKEGWDMTDEELMEYLGI